MSSPSMFQVAILKMEALSKSFKVESASILCVAVWRNLRGASAEGFQSTELLIWWNSNVEHYSGLSRKCYDIWVSPVSTLQRPPPPVLKSAVGASRLLRGPVSLGAENFNPNVHNFWIKVLFFWKKKKESNFQCLWPGQFFPQIWAASCSLLSKQTLADKMRNHF